jgi:hypothetical protein
MGIFIISGHMTLGFHFCYLPNTKYTWNQFKCEILDSSNYDDSYGGGDFHMFNYASVLWYKKIEMQKMNI